MPRTKLGSAQYAAEDFRREVRAQMCYLGLSQGDLAKKAGMDPSTLSRRLKDPRRLTLGELESLHRVLRLDLAAVLPLFGASKKDVKAT